MLHAMRSPAQSLGSTCLVKIIVMQQAHVQPASVFIFFLSWHDMFLVQTVHFCVGKESLDWLHSPA